MSARALGELLGSGVIERVEPDRAAADRELFVARRHITTAAPVARSDPTGAFAVGYDDLRLLRNQSQYEGLEVEPEEVDELIAHARAIVGAIRDDLGL
jgi:hypothetical protein